MLLYSWVGHSLSESTQFHSLTEYSTWPGALASHCPRSLSHMEPAQAASTLPSTHDHGPGPVSKKCFILWTTVDWLDPGPVPATVGGGNKDSRLLC